MPAWNAVLNDKQIAAILTYVRGELGGNSAPARSPRPPWHAARKETASHNDP